MPTIIDVTMIVSFNTLTKGCYGYECRTIERNGKKFRLVYDDHCEMSIDMEDISGIRTNLRVTTI